MSLTVRNATHRDRYEAIDYPDDAAEGTVAGFADYIHARDQIVFTHTEVAPAYEGRGIGGQLVRGALDDVRARGLRVIPVCPFVKGWIQRHREYADLVGDQGPDNTAG
ncbi:GNAT family N-acetyltransferase [Lipingzhangella sp. LS1_29]|uniref:GNAT family N-acetyltransferase n=1 Tax=Lipingzhangella rawalii TaxID=2055835 RepID=A0ABU2H685_9ACTN|nr:GNAT family N-acetyltransferase [Lipingzhangella rawalii]MDS1270817.1 GNAT family N-acetyltransferase [Lipingzhangella rawalii]